MPAIDKSTRRVVTLVVLLVIAVTSLRGYLPGSEQVVRERTTDSPAALVVVVALLVGSLAVVALAVVARWRDRRVRAAGAARRSDWFRGGRGQPSWRFTLLAFGLIAGWLLIALLLTRVGPPDLGDPPTQGPGVGATTNTPAPVGGTTPPSPPAPHGNLLGVLHAATVGFLLLLAAGAIAASRRRRWVSQPPNTAEATEFATPDVRSESLARAAELGLAEVGDLSREPRKAIIACFAAMEGELAHVPGAAPQDFDTASEVLARAVAHGALRPDSATQLVDLFEEARFSPHVMNEGHRETAVRVLRLVLAELRSLA
jgi:hypothetical protein